MSKKQSLPLVDWLVNQWEGKMELSNVLLIGAQHLLATTHDMLRCLYPHGLKPENIHLIGKAYSTSRSVYDEMLQDGINVSEDSFYFDQKEAFDHFYALKVEKFVKSIIQKKDVSQYDRVILLDDGGILINCYDRMVKQTKNLVGIEQTTSGISSLKNKYFDFPIINVARSKAKLQYESPWIARAVIREIIYRLNEIDIIPRGCLVLGCGAVGSQIARLAESLWPVAVFDSNPMLGTLGYDEVIRSLNDYNLIIGCVGKPSFLTNHLSLLRRGTVLASASSSDREFSGAYFRHGFEEKLDVHSTIAVDDIYLLNCGFPVNFNGARHSVPPHAIQLTRALLTSGILTAAATDILNTKGLVPLNSKLEESIIKQFCLMCPQSSAEKRQQRPSEISQFALAQ